MKKAFPALVAFVCLAFSPASAEPLRSPLIGTWAVDLNKLPMPPAARPKSVTIKFSQPAEGKMAMQVDIVGGDGSVRHMDSTYTPDGSAVPIQGDLSEADTVAAKMPSPGVMIVALGKGGIPASTRIYTILPGGNDMNETAVYFGQDGKPIMRTNSFSRVR